MSAPLDAGGGLKIQKGSFYPLRSKRKPTPRFFVVNEAGEVVGSYSTQSEAERHVAACAGRSA